MRHKLTALTRVLLPSVLLLGFALVQADVVLVGDTIEEQLLGAPIPLDPSATYLRTESDPAPDALAIDLTAPGLGLLPGDLLNMTPLGDFSAGDPPGDNQRGRLLGVFSASDTLLDATNQNRVVDAVRDLTDNSTEKETPDTNLSGLDTDIDEDFEWTDGATRRVPGSPAATTLFVTHWDQAFDNIFSNNDDPDGDWAVELRRPFVVGNAAGIPGSLTIDNAPGPTTFTRRAIVIANEPGATGTVNVTGGNANLTVGDGVIVGLSGSGTFNIASGGSAQMERVNVGHGSTVALPRPVSTLTVTGTGSNLNLTSGVLIPNVLDSIVVGNSLADVNAVTNADGADLIPVLPAQFSVVADPNDAANPIISVATSGQDADLVVNFSDPVRLVRVTFVDNPEVTGADVSLFAYDENNDSTLAPLSGNRTEVVGTEPTVLEVSAPRILSVRIDSATTSALIDSIEFVTEETYFGGFLTVGRNSPATAEVSGGGTVTIEGAGSINVGGFQIARNPGSGGSALTVSGADSSVTVQGRLPYAVVGDGDRGRLEITAGGTVQLDGDQAFMPIGNRENGTGDVFVSGVGSSIAMTGTNAGINVGREGNGTLIVEDGAEVAGVTFLNVGRNGGGAGTLVVGTSPPGATPSRLTVSGPGEDEEGSPEAAFMTVGRAGSGAATVLADGVVEIIGGDLPFPGFQVGRDGSGGGALVVDGGQLIITSNLTAAEGGWVRIARIGTGVLAIINGGQVLNDLSSADPLGASDGYTVVGQSAGGQGTVIVSGSGSIWNAGALLQIATGGAGAVSVLDQATLVAADIELGPNGNLGGDRATVIGDVLNNGGTVTGGVDFVIDGDYTQTGGTLKIEVRDLAEGGIDVLDITGAADITGGRILMSFADGFLPQTDDSFVILTGGSVNFGTVSLDFEGVAPGFQYEVTATGGALEFTAQTTAVAGAVPACGTVLTSSLVLTGDMVCPGNALILFGASSNGVTLDCDGNSITTSDPNRPAVPIDGVDGATVRNCTIETTGRASSAINVTGFSTNILITGNDLITNGTQTRPVTFRDTRFSEISNNTMTMRGVGSQTVQLFRSSNNLIDGNTISTGIRGYHAIDVRANSSNNIISNNDVQSTFAGVRFRFGADANLVTGNTFNSGSDAVRFDSSSDNEVIDNTFDTSFRYVRSRHFPLQNGGMSVDATGRLYLVENNFGSESGLGTATAMAELDPVTGAAVSVIRVVESGSGLNVEVGADALEITPGPDRRFLGIVGGSDNTLFEVDPDTGAAFAIDLVLPALTGNLNGLEALSDTSLLATTNQGQLVSINLPAGTATVIGAAGIGLTGISGQPGTGTIFVTSRWRDESTLTSHLYEIDTTTAAITEVGDTGLAFLSDIDFAPDGTLFATDGSVYELDLTTGASTFIGGPGPDPFEPPSENNRLSGNTYQTDDGSIRFTDTITLPTGLGTGFTQNHVFVGLNEVFVDTAARPFLDRPAQVTLNNPLPGTEAVVLVDLEDDGSFALCGTDRCSGLNFTGGTLTFDVTGFTTYTSTDELRIEVSGPNPGQFEPITSTGPVDVGDVPVVIEFVDGYVPDTGDNFEFFSGELASFAPASVMFEGVDPAFTFDVDEDLGADGSLRFVATDDAAPAPGTDLDGDGVVDDFDNCDADPNPDQADADGDLIGDVCDTDDDNDGLVDLADNASLVFNPGQLDTDNDGVPNVSDNCPSVANPGQEDTDGDLVGDVCDTNVITALEKPSKRKNQPPPDTDGDGIADTADNCPSVANAGQEDTDGDGAGDACDLCLLDPANDGDGDGVCGNVDNCPFTANANQLDSDGDGTGNACDALTDVDGDTFAVPEDCDDNNSAVNPDALEIPGNGVDDDCDIATPDSDLRIDFAVTPDLDTFLPVLGANLTVTATVQTATGPAAVPIVFTPVTSNLPGAYTNDQNADPSPDYTWTIAGNVVTLVSNDFGGSVTIEAQATVDVGGAPVTITGQIQIPRDSDGNGLPDAWEQAFGNLEADGDIDTSPANPYTGDGLSSFEEYRGFVWGPPLVLSAIPDYATDALVPQGPAEHFRTDPRRKDLFVRYAGYDAANPFALGTAFTNAGIDVHAAEADSVPPGDPPNIDVATITNEPEQPFGFTDCRINKREIRDWSWDTKGASGVGDGVSYGSGTTTYQCALEGYFGDRPYLDAALGTAGVLDTITEIEVEDVNDNGVDDRRRGRQESEPNEPGVLEGDLYVPGEFSLSLTAFDINNNGLVELPTSGRVEDIDPAFEYTAAQVLKSTITHELGHAVGARHTQVAGDLMFEFSTDWSRDGHFSDEARSQLQIHNQ